MSPDFFLSLDERVEILKVSLRNLTATKTRIENQIVDVQSKIDAIEAEKAREARA
jgi:prefoldin subunit 5